MNDETTAACPHQWIFERTTEVERQCFGSKEIEKVIMNVYYCPLCQFEKLENVKA